MKKRLRLKLHNNDKEVYVTGFGSSRSNWFVQTFVEDADEEKVRKVFNVFLTGDQKFLCQRLLVLFRLTVINYTFVHQEGSKRFKTIFHHVGVEEGFTSHIGSCTWGSRDPITDIQVARKPATQLTNSCSFDAYRCPDEDCAGDVVPMDKHEGESETVSVAIICNKHGLDLRRITKKIIDTFSHAFIGK